MGLKTLSLGYLENQRGGAWEGQSKEGLGKGAFRMVTLRFLGPGMRAGPRPMVINPREEASRACEALDARLRNGASL